MKWRCLNDTFGYCSGTPEPKTSPNAVKAELAEEYTFVGGKCRLDPKTCTKYQLLSEQTASMGLVGGNYRHTQTGKKEAKAKKGGKK